jgi:predicted nucleic acid-binding protein
MNVLVDTSIWSLALRRHTEHNAESVELAALVTEGRAKLIGPIRQEILSGVRSKQQFERLRDYLRSFPDAVIGTEDYERAAELFNTCRTQGVQGNQIDFLICAIALREDLDIYTTDKDFTRYAQHIPLRLYVPRGK